MRPIPNRTRPLIPPEIPREETETADTCRAFQREVLSQLHSVLVEIALILYAIFTAGEQISTPFLPG
jgi:hypothetical protein